MSVEDVVEEKSKRRRKRRNKAEEETEAVETEASEMEAEDTEEEEHGVTEVKGRATPGKRSRQESLQTGGNFLVRGMRAVRGYLSGVKDELDKVVWPTREELIRLVWIVLAVTIVSATVLGIISLIYNEIFVIGIREGHPVIFAALFGVVGIGYFLYSRKSHHTTQY